jgi:hypothetical protein
LEIASLDDDGHSNLLWSPMRYFKATEINRAEADHIRLTSDDSVSKIVVISLGTRWYDVRRLTERELRDFVDQLMREELALIRAGCDTPH